MPEVMEFYHQTITNAIYRPIRNNRLKFITYLGLAFCIALLLSITFGQNYDGSRQKHRGDSKRAKRQATPPSTTSSDFKEPFPARPRIQTRNGHLIIEASQDKNIDFKTSGSRGTITINGHKLDQLLDVTKALERSVQFGTTNAGLNRSPGSLLSAAASGRNGADQYEVVLRNLFASNERFATIERNIDELRNQVSKLSTKLDKVSRKLSKRLSFVNKLNKQQESILIKLKRNDCFNLDTGQPVCKNGATCLDSFDGFKCLCPPNYEGLTCELDIDECAKFRGTDLGCQNGARCINLPGSYRCECPTQYHGVHCTEQHDDCGLSSSQSLCGHGKCINLARQIANQARYECVCDQGWTTDGVNPACVIDINECLIGQSTQIASAGGAILRSNDNYSTNSQQVNPLSSWVSLPWSNSLLAAYPCSQNPFVECTNLPGSFQCGPCPPGYIGNGRICRDLDECQQNNGGCSIQPLVECTNTQGSRRCGACPPGYTGDGVACTRISACSAELNGGCHPMAKCIELASVSLQARICVCQYPFVSRGSDGVGPTGCKPLGGAAVDANSNLGQWTNLPSPSADANYNFKQDDCNPSRCLNDAECIKTDSSFECICSLGWTGRLCDERASVCGGAYFASKGRLKFPLGGSFNELVKMSTDRLAANKQATAASVTTGERHYNCQWSITVAGNMSVQLILSELVNKLSPSKRIQMFLANSSLSSIPSQRLSPNAPACAEFLDVRERLDAGGGQLDLDQISDTWRLIARFCTETITSLKSTPLPAVNSGKQRELTLLTESNQVVLEYSFSATRTQFGEPSLAFALNWSQTEPPCGGELKVADSGSISSPRFPEFYAPGTECRYIIRVPAGKRIRIQVGELNLLTPMSVEPANCADSLTLLDGSIRSDRPILFRHCANNATLMGKAAQSSSSKPIVSSSSSVELILLSQLNSAAPLMRPKQKRGFYLTYASEPATPGCGGLYTQKAATIKSSDYEPSQNGADDLSLALQLSGFFDPKYSEETGSGGVAGWLSGRLGSPFPPFAPKYSYRPEKLQLHQTIVSGVQQGGGGSSSGRSARLYRTRCEYEIRPADQGRNHKVSLDWLEMPSETPVEASALSQWSRRMRCAKSRLTVYDGNYLDGANRTEIATFCSGDKYNASITPMLPIISSSHLLVLVYESAIVSTAAASAGAGIDNQVGPQSGPGGFKLHYSTVCLAIYNQLSGRIQAEVDFEVSECIYHIMLPPNNTMSLRIEPNMSESMLLPDGTCAAQAIFMDGAIEQSKFALLGAESQLKAYNFAAPFSSAGSSNSQGIGSTNTRAGDISGDFFYGSTSTSSVDGNTFRASSSGSSNSEDYNQGTGGSAKEVSGNSYWQYSSSQVHDIKEFEVCRLPMQSFDFIWNHMSLLVRLNPRALDLTKPQIGKVQLTARYQAEPACGGIISEPREGAFNLDATRKMVSLNSFPLTAARFEQLHKQNFVNQCAWILKAPPNQLVELNFDYPAAEIERHYKDWLDWSRRKNTTTLNGNTKGDSKGQQQSIVLPLIGQIREFNCSQVFEESIEIYEPSLDRTRQLCPTDLIGQNPLARWQTQSNIVYIRLRNQSGSSGGAQTVNNSTALSPSQKKNAFNGTYWPGRKPLNSSLPFVVKYKFRPLSSRRQCGGKLIHDSGIIRSPRFPFNYPPNSDCIWLIQANPRQQIRLNITKFELERQSGCLFDYLEIHNGPLASSPLVGRFCNKDLNNKVIISHSGSMRLQFRSDAHLSRSGFEIYYDGAQTGCGGRLTTPTGQIDSPNYPLAYAHSSDCEWAIEVSQSNRIELKIVDLDLNTDFDANGNTTKCKSSDYLEIFDSGSEFQTKSLGRFCDGRDFKPRDTFLSRDNKMFIVFKSQALDNSRGFRISYKSYCASIELVGFRGTIESPGFPSGYLPYLDCEWNIEAPLGSNLTLVITDMNIESSIVGSGYDLLSTPMTVNLINGSSNSSSSGTSKQRRCTKNALSIKPFYTSSNGSQLTNSSKTMQQVAASTKDLLKSPSALIYCGQLSSLNESERTIELDSDSATIKFRSDRTIEFGGFRIEWQSQGCGGQQSRDSIQPVNYHEHHEPLNRPTECLWSFDLSRAGATIEFHLNSDMRSPEVGTGSNTVRDPCKEASLIIYDGIDTKSPIISKNCDSQRMRETIQTSSPYALVRFYTSGKHSYGRGFMLSGWPSNRDGCLSSVFEISTPFNQLAGTKTSPNYPDLYDGDSQSRCYGLQSAQTGRLRYRFEELDIPTEPARDGDSSSDGSALSKTSGGLLDADTCRSSGNFFIIRNLAGKTVEEVFCGRLNPDSEKDVARATVVLEQEAAWTEFNSRNGLRGRWKLSYDRLCGSVTQVDYPHEFTSPNYPAKPNWPKSSQFGADYDNPAKTENVCAWRLKTNYPHSASSQAEKKLHLNIVNFFESNRDSSDCLRIYEGVELSLRRAEFNLTDLDLKYQPKIKICKQSDIKNSNLYYVSQGGELTVLVTGETVVKFRVKPFENFCGGEFLLRQAEFGSPDYPQPYTTDLDCHYFIIGSPGSRVNLKFLAFDLPEGESINSGDDSNDSPSSGQQLTANDNPAAMKCDNVDYIEIRQLSIGKKIKSRLNNALLSSSSSPFKWTQLILSNALKESGNSSSNKRTLNLTTTTAINSTDSTNTTNATVPLSKSTLAAARLYELAHLYFLFSDSTNLNQRFGSHASTYLRLDDFYENSKLLGRFCGKRAPVFGPNQLLQDEVLIRFRSHSAKSPLDGAEGTGTGGLQAASRGFLAEYGIDYGGFIQLQPELTQSQQQVIITDSTASDDEQTIESGFISSPMYPAKVRYNGSISWQIETKLGYVIQFDLISLELGSIKQDCQDTLSFFDGLNPSTSIRLSQLCGHLSFKNLQYKRWSALFSSQPVAAASANLLPVYLAHDPKVKASLIRSIRTTSNVASVVYDNFRGEGLFALRYKAVSEASLPRQQDGNRTAAGGIVDDDLSAPLDAVEAIHKQESFPFDSKRNATKSCSHTYRLSLENGPPTYSSPLSPQQQQQQQQQQSNSTGSQQVVLASPNWPNMPPPDVDCHWLVYTQENTNIKLSIDPTDMSNLADDDSNGNLLSLSDLYRKPDYCLETPAKFSEIKRSFIAVHDGATRLAPIIGRYCLPASPIQVQSSGRHMLVRYIHADHIAAAAQTLPAVRSLFKARASVGDCGGQYHILSSNRVRDRQSTRSKTYSNNLNCRYYLFAANQDRVLIINNEMSEFELAGDPNDVNCSSSGDYIEVHDLPIQTELMDFSRSVLGRSLGRYCAGRRLEFLEAPGSAISIEFHTDGQNVAKGWELFVMSSLPRVNCPRGYAVLNLDEPFGRFTSPNWPHGFYGRRHCKYHLVAPNNQSIQVTFVRLQRPKAQLPLDSKCGDNLHYLADNEASSLRFDVRSLPELQSPLSGTLMRQLVAEIPCSNAHQQQQQQVSEYSTGDKLVQAIDSAGFKKISANDYFKLADEAPHLAFTIRTDSHVLMLDYETKNLLPKEGFVAIYKLIDDRRFNCGGEISYDAGASGKGRAAATQARNLIESAKFGEETSESGGYIQCDWLIKSGGQSLDYMDGARLSIGFNMIPTANLSSFKSSYIVFDTLEIPPQQPGGMLFDDQWSSERIAKSNELCGLNRMLISDPYFIRLLYACGNLTELNRWTLLDYSVRRISLRTKNLRAAPTGNDSGKSASAINFYRGVRGYFYEKSCLQMERLIGEGVRFRSHSQYPDSGSYSPGICRWDLHLNGGDYELWLDSVQFRPPEGYVNTGSSAGTNSESNSSSAAFACDVSNPDLDYIEIRAAVERDAPVLTRYCFHNQLVAKQKVLLLNMKSDISILFVAGVKQLASGIETFGSGSSSASIATNKNQDKRSSNYFGFDLQLIRIRNESESEFCRRDMRHNIYWFIKNKEHEYYDNSAYALTSSLTSFLYPKNSHCVVELNVEEGARINISFKGIFDLESSKDCQNDYIQIDDLIPLNYQPANSTTSTGSQQPSAIANVNTSKQQLPMSKFNATHLSFEKASEQANVKRIGRWCGRSRPAGYFLSSADKLRITFHSNERIEGKGFQLEYSTVPSSNSVTIAV